MPTQIKRRIDAHCDVDHGEEQSVTNSTSKRSRDAGWEAHRAAISHLEACEEALYAADRADDLTEMESPAAGPYCGCSDCDVRETLAVAWPILLDDGATLVAEAGYEAAAELLRAEATRVRQLLRIR